MLAFALILAAALQDEPLYAQIHVPAGYSPVDLVAVDLTGDGRIDVVSANLDSDDVTVMASLGGGSFAAPVAHATGPEPRGIAAGDLDGDGLLDVVAGGVLQLDVLLGQGGGTLGPPTAFPVSGWLDFEAHGLVLGDLDGDGMLDAAATSGHTLTPGVEVLLGDGTGALGAPALQPTALHETDVAVADANADGALDLLVTTSADTLELFLGSGTGAFAAPLSTPLAPGPVDVEALDLDLDGDLDAAVAHLDVGPTSLSVLAGDGAGGFAPPALHPVGPTSITTVGSDLDGDGDPDLVVADYGGVGALRVLENLGGLAFAPAVVAAEGHGSHGLAIADLTGDGELDAGLACPQGGGGAQGAVVVLAGLADLHVGGPEALPAGGEDLAVADLDGDGAAELVFASSDLGVQVLPGTGVSFGAPSVHAVGPAPDGVVAADFDGDGAPDVATTSHALDTAAVALGDGLGGLGPATLNPTHAGPRAPAAGDLDGDGRVDLAYLGEGAGVLAALLGDGAGGLAAGTSQSSVTGPRAMLLGDVDNDGALDAAVTGAGTFPFDPPFWLGDGVGGFHLGDGTGGFGALVSLFTGLATDVALEDLDQDGVLDLAFLERHEWAYNPPRVVLFHGDGSGGFSPALVLPSDGTSGEAVALAAGDLDRDGDVDLVASIDQGFAAVGTLAVHRNGGGGAWSQPIQYAGIEGPLDASGSIALHDADGDGFLDVAVANAWLAALQRHLWAEPAGLTPFGSGTPGCAGAHALGANRAPAVGAADFALTGTNAPPHAAGIAAVGLAPDAGGTVALDVRFHLDLGAPLPVLLSIASDGAGAAFAPLPIPSLPGLAGVTVYAQALWPWAPDAACDPSALLWSSTPGLAITIP
jgi:hypothetical protein